MSPVRTAAKRRRRPSRRGGGDSVPTERSRGRARAMRGGALGAAALALGLLALYGLWLRDSSLVRIERVEVSGLTGPDALRLRGRLVATARRMTTLNVRAAALERALAGHPALRGVEVDPRLPRTLEVTVLEHRPVARLRVGRREGPPVAADGTLLRGLEVTRPLPVVGSGSRPSRRARRLPDRRGRRLVRTLAAAPEPLGPRLATAAEVPFRGIVVRFRQGPELVVGNDTRLEAKWAAAARVLADPSTRGARYVDVRLPERPVAGGFPPRPLDRTPPAALATAPGAEQISGAALSTNPRP